MGRRTDKEVKKLQAWAKSELLNNNLTLKEIAQKLKVTEKTIGKWNNEFGWDKIKAATIISKPEQLAMIYNQINELNLAIKNKDEGKRYASSSESDTLIKLTKSAKNLEGELGLSEIINVSIPLLEFVKKIDYKTSLLLQNYIDEFIRNKING